MRVFVSIVRLVPVAAALCLAGSLGQAQSIRDGTELTIEACLATPPALQEMTEALEPLGWERVLQADLSDADLYNLVMTRLKEKLFFTAQTEEHWKYELSRERSNAAGIKRKVEADDAALKNVYFTHGNGGHLLWLIVENYDAFDQARCSFVVRPDFAANSLAHLEHQLTDDMPTIVPLKPRHFGGGDVRKELRINLFRRQEISSFLKEEFPFMAMVETYQSTPR